MVYAGGQIAGGRIGEIPAGRGQSAQNPGACFVTTPFFWRYYSVITEITDAKNERGWVLFDAECLLCRRLVRRWRPMLRRHRFALVPLQTPWVRERLAKCDRELLSEMRLLTAEGLIYGGA